MFVVLGGAKNGLQKWSVLDVFRTAKVVAATQENASVQLFCELYTAPVLESTKETDIIRNRTLKQILNPPK